MRKTLCVVGMLVFVATAVFAATPEDEIMQADRDFNKATQEKRAEGWLSYFALDDAAVPDPPTAGPEAITARYQKMFSNPDFTLSWNPIRAEVFPSGRMGYTTGKYVARFKDKDGKRMVSKGRYITVWRKQEDGSWKIVTDTGGPDGPPQPAN